VAELLAGLALLPAEKRQTELQQNLEKSVLPLFAGRVLSFDLVCTQAYADLMAAARTTGLDVATADGDIAAIARANDLTVATRDTAPRGHRRGRDQPLKTGDDFALCVKFSHRNIGIVVFFVYPGRKNAQESCRL